MVKIRGLNMFKSAGCGVSYFSGHHDHIDNVFYFWIKQAVCQLRPSCVTWCCGLFVQALHSAAKLLLFWLLCPPAEQEFAGNCTKQVEFYNSTDDYNYKRAVTWSIVMAYLSHTHPAFETVYTIEAVNEPLQDANLTPGLGRCEFLFSWVNKTAQLIQL